MDELTGLRARVTGGSIAATAGLPQRAVYSASKGAVDGRVAVLRLRPRS